MLPPQHLYFHHCIDSSEKKKHAFPKTQKSCCNEEVVIVVVNGEQCVFFLFEGSAQRIRFFSVKNPEHTVTGESMRDCYSFSFSYFCIWFLLPRFSFAFLLSRRTVISFDVLNPIEGLRVREWLLLSNAIKTVKFHLSKIYFSSHASPSNHRSYIVS